MKHLRIKIALFLNYFVFAAILNSVGILIQKSINIYNIGELEASQLEPIKDLTIAFASFLVGTFLTRIGYKKAFLISLAVVMSSCLCMYFIGNFWTVKLLFVSIGLGFATIKVSILAIIGLITDSKKSHSSFMSQIESFFMVGIVFTFLVFPMFYSETNPAAWLDVYLLFFGLLLLVFLIVLFTKFEWKEEIANFSILKDLKTMFNLCKNPLVLLFIIFAIFYVMTEQGIMSWLPTFNQKVFNMTEKLGAQMAVILTISFAVGRFLTSFAVRFIRWNILITFCLILAASLVIIVLPQIQGGEYSKISAFSDIPIEAFIFPLIGLFLAPIYPLVNSNILSATDKSTHSSLAGLLTFFSAIGGTIGSLSIAFLFKSYGGQKAFYFSLFPICMLIFVIYFLQKKIADIETK